MTFWPSDTAGRIADVCSVLGLVVTAILTVGANQVRKQLFVYPKYAEKLDGHCNELVICLNDFPYFQAQARMEVSRIKGNMTSLRPYMLRPLGQRSESYLSVLNAISNYESVSNSENLRTVLNNLLQLQMEVSNMVSGI